MSAIKTVGYIYSKKLVFCKQEQEKNTGQRRLGLIRLYPNPETALLLLRHITTMVEQNSLGDISKTCNEEIKVGDSGCFPNDDGKARMIALVKKKVYDQNMFATK